MDHAEILAMISAAPQGLQDSMRATISRALAVLRIPRPMRLSQWAERHFYLSAESSYVEGAWRCWPYQVGMMDVMAHDQVSHVTIRKSARVGYTKMFLACIGYMAEHKRRNQIVYQPTDDDRDEFVTSELEPMLRDVRVMRRVMRRFHGRSKHNTLRQKKFTTGMLHLRGGKAAKNYRRLTAECVYYDEFSGFDRDIEKEGSPGKLGDKRLEGATYPKSIAGSTPKLRHNDNTEDREAEADLRLQWHVPCWHCQELHPITWGGPDKPHGLKWRGDDPSTAVHVCPHCGAHVTEAQYLEVWHAGRWIDPDTGAWLDTSYRHSGPAEAALRTAASLDWRVCDLHPDPATILPMPCHVAMPVWTACAPQATWPMIVEEYLAAMRLAERGDVSLLKTWTNTTLGETWEEVGESSDEHALQRRAEPYPLRTVPAGALRLTAGIDVQGNRWELDVWGWGRGMESWLIDSHVIDGNPADEREWEALDLYLQRRYPQAYSAGATSIGIDAISIDSGHHSQAVYQWAYRQQGSARQVYVIKGSSEDGKPIRGTATGVDVTWRGQRWPNGIKLWVIGVDTAKDLLHGQLAIATPGPGYVHTSKDLPREWYEQITAEQRMLVRTPTGDKYRWTKRRPRNEKLDCRNYAVHAAYMLGLHQYADAAWTRLQAAVEPDPDLFSPAPSSAPPADDTQILAAPRQVVRDHIETPAILSRPTPRRAPAAPTRDW